MSEQTTIQVQAVRRLVDGRMDTENASRYVGLSVKTMAMLRCRGTGPRFIKMGKIFYYQQDLDSWLGERARVQSTAQAMFNSR